NLSPPPRLRPLSLHDALPISPDTRSRTRDDRDLAAQVRDVEGAHELAVLGLPVLEVEHVLRACGRVATEGLGAADRRHRLAVDEIGRAHVGRVAASREQTELGV